MKEIKENRISFRIHNPETTERLEKVYKHMQELFKNKSNMYAECLMRGMESLENEFLLSNGVRTMGDLIKEIQKHSKAIDMLAELMQQSYKNTINTTLINQRLLTRCYAMLLGLNTEQPKKDICIIRGDYDDVPKEIEKAINKLVDELFK